MPTMHSFSDRYSKVILFFPLLQLSEKDMSMLEERIKRSAKKPSGTTAPVKLQPEEEASGPANVSLLRKPSSEASAVPRKLR